MKTNRTCVVGLCIGATSWTTGTARATVINFDNLATSVLVTNQYAGVTFSSEPGEGLYTSGGTPTSYPHSICTAPINGSIDCVNDVYVDFATPVGGLSIWCIEPNQYGVVATCFLYNGATLLGTQNIIGLAAAPSTFGYGNQFVDLSSFNNVTRLEIRGPGGVGDIDNSEGGVGCAWDDLTYKDVPAPGTLSLLAFGAVFARRRR